MRKLCWLILGVYVLLAALSATGMIATDFNQVNNDLSYQAPSNAFFFGTDLFGRSVLQRSIHASQTALLVGGAATVISALIGVILGFAAGYRGGWIDDVVVWLYTTFDSIPYVLLLAGLAFSLGQGLTKLVIALGLTLWTTLCKLVRTEVQKQKHQDYVLAARALGQTEGALWYKHILPNLRHLIAVQMGFIFVAAIKIEVLLSYLGLGVEPGRPSWGLMIDDARQELAQGIWWNLGAATLFMAVLILAVTGLFRQDRDISKLGNSASWN